MAVMPIKNERDKTRAVSCHFEEPHLGLAHHYFETRRGCGRALL